MQLKYVRRTIKGNLISIRGFKCWMEVVVWENDNFDQNQMFCIPELHARKANANMLNSLNQT